MHNELSHRYVYEHAEHHGFPSEWIGVTFSSTTFWNGMLAILAGVVSNFTAEGLGYGPVAPFVVATVPLVVSGVLVLRLWPENYGKRSHKLIESCADGFKVRQSSLILTNIFHFLLHHSQTIMGDRKILLLGCIQTTVESCMYIFVFLWTPVLMPAHPPLGMVFACFMVAIMIGSSCFTLLQSRRYEVEEILRIVLMVMSAALAVCTAVARADGSNGDHVVTLAAFLLLELSLGMYFPAISYAKSQVIPEAYRANVMNWFRVPMNVITCATLLCLHIDWIAADKRIVFGGCFVLAILGVVIAGAFISEIRKDKKIKSGNSSKQLEESKQSLLDNEEE